MLPIVTVFFLISFWHKVIIASMFLISVTLLYEYKISKNFIDENLHSQTDGWNNREWWYHRINHWYKQMMSWERGLSTSMRFSTPMLFWMKLFQSIIIISIHTTIILVSKWGRDTQWERECCWVLIEHWCWTFWMHK